MKLIYAMLIFIVFVSACGNKDDKKEKSAEQPQHTKSKGNTIVFTPAQIVNGGIDTGHLTMHELASAIHVNGQVDVPPGNLISINVPLGGFLKRTAMLPGEPVKRGQVIAQVQNQDYITMQQDYLTATSKLAYLKQEMERQQVLSKQQASPLKLYQQTVSDYNSEAAQAAGLAQKLRMISVDPVKLTPATIISTINITSPINGFVSKVNVSMGRFVNPTDVLMELVNTSDIHAALTVFEQDIAKITIGAAVKITLPSIPDKTYPGKVILIGRMLDTSHSVTVHCHFLTTDKNLLPNMFIQADIESKPQKTMAVPDGALVNFGGQQYLFIAERKGKNVLFSMVPVDIGTKQNGWNEIKLSKPEVQHKIFVLKGAFAILSAMKNTGDDS